ncbi:MAG: sigma-70 family RNA polymerase sigma factor [Elusimicrobia bacterium]|nr:sigma-70 family RNA polymerase sigma factor [Elusimicrobiota bacterium]
MERLVAEHAGHAYHFAYQLCGSTEESKELVQEAFYRVFRSWDRYDPSQPMDKWLLSILRNVYMDSVRSTGRRCSVDLDAEMRPGHEESHTFAEGLPDGEEAVLDRLARESELESVRRAMKGLKSEYQAILTLFDVKGLGYDQIAEVLDCPLGTVRSRLNRARAALKRSVLESAERR